MPTLVTTDPRRGVVEAVMGDDCHRYDESRAKQRLAAMDKSQLEALLLRVIEGELHTANYPESPMLWPRPPLSPSIARSSAATPTTTLRDRPTLSFQAGSTASLNSVVGREPVKFTAAPMLAPSRFEDAGFDTISDYVVLDVLGCGSYGVVYLACDAANEKVAIKSVSKKMLRRNSLGARETVDVQHEIDIMKSLRHKNVVPLYEVIDDEQNDRMYMVMKYIEGGSLLDLSASNACPTIDESALMFYMRQVSAGLLYLHRHKVIHRDVKPENILVHGGTIYLSDFGVSQFFGEQSRGQAGTPSFSAPECFDDGEIGDYTDAWAMGVTMFCLAFGRPPFVGTTYQELAHAILHDPLVIPNEPRTSCACKDALTKLLEKDPKKRMSVAKFRKHAFIQDSGRRSCSSSDTTACSSPDGTNSDHNPLVY